MSVALACTQPALDATEIERTVQREVASISPVHGPQGPPGPPGPQGPPGESSIGEDDVADIREALAYVRDQAVDISNEYTRQEVQRLRDDVEETNKYIGSQLLRLDDDIYQLLLDIEQLRSDIDKSAATYSPSAYAPSIPRPLSGSWRGLTIAPEYRCSPYDAGDYPYPQSVEAEIVLEMGGLIYAPYSGKYFESTYMTDIEHIVARSEAHDSGLCAADSERRAEFASDLLNLTLADPAVNRILKSDKDAAEWLPVKNQCWFADRVVRVRSKYGLTVDQAEADALEMILSICRSVDMVIDDAPAQLPSAVSPFQTPTPAESGTQDALALYDDNGNGRITCAEARAHGIAPVHRGHPAYEYMRDGDNDGTVCE